MHKITFILTFFLLFSCNKKEALDNDLKKIIIDYQKRYPIPNGDNYKSNRFVYTLFFQVKNKDTIFLLSRSANGLIPEFNGYGVFQDKVLKPTFIYDNKAFSKNFVFERSKNDAANGFYLDLKVLHEACPPIYTYSIKNKNINFNKNRYNLESLGLINTEIMVKFKRLRATE
ncbi:hypothetical protein ACFSJW_06820 [Flavobacterium artemisiae]|uniref:Lipoprotein n=1 Tax=Flavobacterium artemisiae TaxID=2126556 RepID=A0ABW4HCN1_9FLAO